MLQTTPEDFNLLLSGMLENSMMIGIRADRKDSGFKRFQSKFANGFRNMMTHDGAKDTGCPLKVLRTEVADRYSNHLRRASSNLKSANQWNL